MLDRRLLAVALVAAAACGRVSFELRADGGGPDVADSGPLDAPWPTGPFGQIMLATGVDTSGDDDDPTLTDDQLEVYFEADVGVEDIYVARRSSITAPWSTPVVDTALQSPNIDLEPSVSADGLVMMLGSNRPAGANYDIYMSTRTLRADAWSTPVLVTELSTTGDDHEPTISRSGLELVMVRFVGGNFELMHSTRPSSSAPWSSPVLLTQLNSAATEYSPCFAHDDLELWFASDRIAGGVDTDIYVATRSDLTQPFGSPQLVAELATTNRDEDPWLSPDGHTLYFVRGPPGTGPINIYMATR
jgi:hypothetical protein